MRSIHVALAFAAVTLAGCNSKPAAAQAPGAEITATMGAQLDSLGAMTPAQMTAGLPAHQALASQMMTSMSTNMQGMRMQPNAGWMALTDSLRQDLTAMPSLNGGALESRMQSHIVRMRRMMTMYQGMMPGGMMPR